MKVKPKTLLLILLPVLILMLGGCILLSKTAGQSHTSRKENASYEESDETAAVHELVEQMKQQSIKQEFPLIQVIDDGTDLPANQEYTGLVCNIKDTYIENKSIQQTDGSTVTEKVFTMYLNNVQLSVPDGGTKAFGVPIFSTEAYTDEEQETQKKWHYVMGKDCPDFNAGMDVARNLILKGYFQEPLEKFLLRYPELNPTEREYVLRLIDGGRTDRTADNTSWWDLYYRLETTADNGEIIPMAYIDITRVFLAQGEPVTYDDAQYRIWSAEGYYWHLLENPAEDLGNTWISQLPDEDFSTQEQICAYVESQGGDFDCLLPAGANSQVKWDFHMEESLWYDYLVWSGTTDTYEITLAIPLMEEEAGGWYMASRIKKEAANKKVCQHTLSTMMQTFHAVPYVHMVKEGESLWSIYKKYEAEESAPYSFASFINYNCPENPDLIYPGQSIAFP